MSKIIKKKENKNVNELASLAEKIRAKALENQKKRIEAENESSSESDSEEPSAIKKKEFPNQRANLKTPRRPKMTIQMTVNPSKLLTS